MGLTKSESEVITLFQRGDKKSFEQLYDQYAPMLFGVVSRVVPDPRLAVQVFQQSFIYLWQNKASYDPRKERFFTWMNKCALQMAVSVAKNEEKMADSAPSENQDTGFYVNTKDR